VFGKVYNEMDEMGLSDAPERFLRFMQLLMSGYGGLEVYTGLFWDFNESLENLNKMFKRIGTDFQLLLRSIHKGLRIRGRESPIIIPTQ
jgi:hypothetical protein